MFVAPETGNIPIFRAEVAHKKFQYRKASLTRYMKYCEIHSRITTEFPSIPPSFNEGQYSIWKVMLKLHFNHRSLCKRALDIQKVAPVLRIT